MSDEPCIAEANWLLIVREADPGVWFKDGWLTDCLGVLAPYILLSFRPETSAEDLQYLINTIFPVGKQPLTGEELLREIRLADVYVSVRLA
jgi:hypothetical protein